MESRRRRLIRPDRHTFAAVDDEGSQIVDAVDVVGVRMSVNHGVGPIDPGRNHLFAKIRAGIDNDDRFAVLAELLDQQRCSAAAVFRVFGIAIAPVSADARDAG